jgi:hypothetical protein
MIAVHTLQGMRRVILFSKQRGDTLIALDEPPERPGLPDGTRRAGGATGTTLVWCWLRLFMKNEIPHCTNAVQFYRKR